MIGDKSRASLYESLMKSLQALFEKPIDGGGRLRLIKAAWFSYNDLLDAPGLSETAFRRLIQDKKIDLDNHHTAKVSRGIVVQFVADHLHMAGFSAEGRDA